jgi:hypothetical protein
MVHIAERVSLHNPVLFSRDSELDAQLRISEEAVHVEAPTGGSPTTSKTSLSISAMFAFFSVVDPI